MSNTAPQGFFSAQANTLDASGKLPFFPAGFLGRVRIDACKGFTDRTGTKAYIVELTVVTSNMPDQVFVGGRYSWYQSHKEPGTAYPACIAFLYAALGLNPSRDVKMIAEQVKPKQDKYLNDSISEAQPFAGVEIMLQTTSKKTKALKDFTLHTFTALPPAPEATAAA